MWPFKLTSALVSIKPQICPFSLNILVMGKFWPAGRIFLAKLNAMFSCKWPSKPKSAALYAGKHLMHLKGNKLKFATSSLIACRPQKLFREIWVYASLHYLLFLDSRTTSDRLRETFFAITLWNCQYCPDITWAVREDCSSPGFVMFQYVTIIELSNPSCFQLWDTQVRFSVGVNIYGHEGNAEDCLVIFAITRNQQCLIS